MLGASIQLLDHSNERVVYKCAFLLVDLYDADIIANLRDFDSIYIDFKIGESKFTLHQHIMDDISIYITNEDFTQQDLILLNEIAEKLKTYIEDDE